MAQYLLRRLLLLTPTFLGITLLVFLVTRAVPGGPLEQMLAESDGVRGLPPALRDALNRQYGLDQPVFVAYARWLRDLATGDLGTSYQYHLPVRALIAERLPVTAALGLAGFLLAYLVSVPLGVLRAWRDGAPLDVAAGAAVVALYAVPGWALGALLLVALGSRGWVPLGGMPDGDGWLDAAHHLALPVFAYAAGSFATIAGLAKTSLLEAIGQDFVRTARAKGLGEARVWGVHALRAALVPLCAALGRSLGALLAGAFLIERVFNLPGLGLLGFEALRAHDYAVAMGVLVVNTALALLGNLAGDVAVALADPRVRFS